MSPRRLLEPDEVEPSAVQPHEPAGFVVPADRPRRWGLPVIAGLAAVLMAVALGFAAFMTVAHESDRRTAIRDADALGYVRAFMTAYTTLDPFNANDYADRIRAQGAGEFATKFTEKQNEIVVQVARAEPTTGTVLEAGVQRWNDDGSADILVATKIMTTTPDGKQAIETGSRWLATTVKEGQQWKISRLIQVI